MRRSLPALVVCALTLGACGSDDGSRTTASTGSSTASAATGTTTGASTGAGTEVSGSGYTTRVPEGWTDASEQTKGTALKIDNVYAAPAGGDFKANVVIIRETPRGIAGKKIGELADTIREQAAGAVGAPVPKPDPSTTIDGDDTARWTLRRTQSGIALAQRQFAVIHDDALYSITVSAAAKDPEGEQDARTIVEGWRWK